MPPSDRSYYDLIGVAPDASEHEIRCAYLEKALLLHPDKQQQEEEEEEEASDRFLLLQEAWETLRDAESRHVYDASLRDSELKSSALDGRPILAVIHRHDCIPIATDPIRPDLLDAYLYECRCGEDYLIETSAFIDGRQIIPCGSCSFCLDVIE